MENKICTSIEQSKKLIELGIDVNTADMCHRYRWSNNSFIKLPCAEKAREPITGDIPAWSLSALLNLIPKNVRFNNVLRNVENDKVSWTFFCHAISEYTFDGEDDFECIYKTICWLKENEKI